MSETMKRPGGALASRPLHFIWMVDCSGSMSGEKIGTVNNAIQEAIPEMRASADENPNAQLLVRAVSFSSGAQWITAQPENIENYSWKDLSAGGLTDLGAALDLVSAELTVPPMSERALPPVLVLLSDGQPTSSYKKELDKLLHQPWGKKSVRIAIAIGRDADKDVLAEFTGNMELVLEANNARMLAKMIKWASTVAAVVSAPASRPMPGTADQSNNGSTAPATPIVIDIDSIPKEDPSDIEAGDVW